MEEAEEEGEGGAFHYRLVRDAKFSCAFASLLLVAQHFLNLTSNYMSNNADVEKWHLRGCMQEVSAAVRFACAFQEVQGPVSHVMKALQADDTAAVRRCAVACATALTPCLPRQQVPCSSAVNFYTTDRRSL